jgi:hypothetical protein
MFLFVVSGIWPRGADGTDINNCARSHDNQLMVSADNTFMNSFKGQHMNEENYRQRMNGKI